MMYFYSVLYNGILLFCLAYFHNSTIITILSIMLILGILGKLYFISKHADPSVERGYPYIIMGKFIDIVFLAVILLLNLSIPLFALYCVYIAFSVCSEMETIQFNKKNNLKEEHK